MADLTLTGDRLAELLVLAQPFPLDSASVNGLARHWISVAALAERGDTGALGSEEAIQASTWLERREALLELEREDRLGSSVVVDRLVAEVAFRAGDTRLFAHVLRRVGPETPPEERDLQRRVADQILADLVAGGSWDAAVAESDDLATVDMSGLLGLFSQGELPGDLDGAAFALQPGQVSSVVDALDGFHILYRPRFLDVSGLYGARLRQRQMAEMDAAAVTVVATRRELELERDAVARVRRMALDPWSESGSGDDVTATWQGGALWAATVARYIVALPEPARREMAAAPDPAVEAFLRSTAIREMRLIEAAARGLRLTEADLDRLAEQHATEIAHWRTALDFGSAAQLGGTRMDRYMEEVVARRTEAKPVSPLLEAWLLEATDWEYHAEGVSQAIELATRMIGGPG